MNAINAILYCCCGLDVHRDKICASIISGKDEINDDYAEFATSSKALNELVEWIEGHSCYHVAMESTGVYWKPVYEALEASKSIKEIMVVNAYHMKNVPGRKTDAKDAEWIASLYRSGLLKNSFIPPEEFRSLREQYRLYTTSVADRTREYNRLEKFLQSHGFKLSSIMSDVNGKSGRALLDRLVLTGRITPDDVNMLCKRLKRPKDEICEYVCGTLGKQGRFTLRFILKNIDNISAEIKELVEHMEESVLPYKEQMEIITSIPGIDTIAAIGIISEITANPNFFFTTAERLCNWTGLAPRNDESADSVKSRKILPGNRNLKPLIVQCAWAAIRCRKSHFRDWYWRHLKHLGTKKTVIAIARKLLKLVHLLISRNEKYDFKIAAGIA